MGRIKTIVIIILDIMIIIKTKRMEHGVNLFSYINDLPHAAASYKEQ